MNDFGFGSLGLVAGDFGADTVVQLGQPPQRIDLLTAIDGVTFEECFKRRERVALGDVALNIVGLEDFRSACCAGQHTGPETAPRLGLDPRCLPSGRCENARRFADQHQPAPLPR